MRHLVLLARFGNPAGSFQHQAALKLNPGDGKRRDIPIFLQGPVEQQLGPARVARFSQSDRCRTQRNLLPAPRSPASRGWKEAGLTCFLCHTP